MLPFQEQDLQITGNFTLAVIPIVFLGSINLGLCVYSAVTGTGKGVFRLLVSPFRYLLPWKEHAGNGHLRI